MEESDMPGTDIHNGIIHLDEVVISWEEEKKIKSEWGSMSFEDYIKEVSKYLKIVSDGE